MFPLSGAQKWKKQREINSNVVKLQTKCIFCQCQRWKWHLYKVCFNTKDDSHDSKKFNETDAGDV